MFYEIEIILIKATFPFAVILRVNCVFIPCKYMYVNKCMKILDLSIFYKEGLQAI